jgi:putative transcriptional regulator
LRTRRHASRPSTAAPARAPNLSGATGARLTSAERVRLSRNSINSVENEKFDPSLPLAFRIADAFGLTIEQVFERDE